MSESAQMLGGKLQVDRLFRLGLATLLCGPLAGVGVAIATGAGLLMAPWFLIYGAMFGALFGYPAMLIVGLPAHAFLYRRRRRQARWYLLAGIPAGLFTFIAHVVGVEVFGNGFVGLRWWNVLYFGVFHLGAAIAAGGLFWVLRRPDVDEHLARLGT